MKLDLDRQEGGRSEIGIAGNLGLGMTDGRPETVRIEGVLVVQNMDSRFIVNGVLQATGPCDCGRCLQTFEQSWKVPVDIMVLRKVDSDEDQGETLLIMQRRGEVDLQDALRESAVLAFPQSPVCSKDCQGLCPQCGVDLNTESCTCSDESYDPRWEGLP